DGSIAALARQVRDLVHPEAEITYDTTKPDGTPRKVLEVSKLTKLGWTAKTELADGLANTYAWFLQAVAEGTARL
ncbi:MAG: GDP-L-fucose synthase, partial [Acidimicrobiales bacterium]